MTLPISVSLLVDGQPTIFSGAGRVGRLAVVNQSGAPITLPLRSGQPGRANFHVAVHLPKGSLSAASLASLAVTDGGWALAVDETARGDNRWDSLFLLLPAGLTLADGAELTLLVHGLAADPAGAARHTRAIVEYDVVSASTPLRGSRTIRTYVVPWPHHPAELHLHIGVREGHAVLNRDEIANRIVVALTCTAVDGEVLLVGGRTRLELGWDIGPPERTWWGLCTAAQAEDAEVEVDWNGGAGERLVDPTLDTKAWLSETGAIWRVVVPADHRIAYGESIHIELAGLVTEHPAGPANLVVKVVGAGDGASGHVVLPVHKQGYRTPPSGPQLRTEDYHGAQTVLDTTVAVKDWAAVLCSSSADLRLDDTTTTWRIVHPPADVTDVFGPVREFFGGAAPSPRWHASVLFIRRELLS